MYHHRITSREDGQDRGSPVLVYLASPYTSSDIAVCEERYQAACRATAALIRAGQVVFSPIVHSHPLVAFGLPTTWAAWERID